MPSMALQLGKIEQASVCQHNCAIMEEQHAAVAARTEVGLAEPAQFELRLKAVEEQLDQVAKKLEQSIRSFDTIVYDCRQDMAAHTQSAVVGMSQLQKHCRMLDDRLIVLELDVSSTPETPRTASMLSTSNAETPRTASTSNVTHTPQS